MRRLLLVILLGLVVVGACAPQELDVSPSATLEERRMGFDALCQHLKFEAMDRIVLPAVSSRRRATCTIITARLRHPTQPSLRCSNPPLLATGPKTQPATG